MTKCFLARLNFDIISRARKENSIFARLGFLNLIWIFIQSYIAVFVTHTLKRFVKQNMDHFPFPFIGRKRELKSLNDLLTKKISSLVVIRGRRRIGKSRLIQEFTRDKKTYVFAGLPPEEKISAQDQRNEFIKQMNLQMNHPEVYADDWSKVFQLLSKETEEGQVIIVLDEISWMASKDPTFLGKLKNAWENYFKKNPKLVLILCGSVSSWIEKNILSSTGFFGRVSLKITLQELSLAECNLLLDAVGFKRSQQEKLKLLSITGGIPWYLELIHPEYSANSNIKKLCFEKDGIFVDEFNYIFHDLFGKRAEICKKIVEQLVKEALEYTEITKGLGYARSGSISDYLNDLMTSGFISKDRNWSFKTGRATRLSRYRLRDNYLRFYLKYIEPRLEKIEQNQFDEVSLEAFPNWEGVMGLQFENLVLNNRKLIQQALGIKSDEIVFDNPYFQHKTRKQTGCQVDYLIQTKYKNLFLCEFKFTTGELNHSIVDSLERKIASLIVPKGFAILPVLIYTGNISNALRMSDFFYKIIDFNEFLVNDY